MRGTSSVVKCKCEKKNFRKKTNKENLVSETCNNVFNSSFQSFLYYFWIS